MNSIFTFSWLCDEHDFQVFFKTPGHTPSSYFEEAIKNAAQSTLYPDGIIILSINFDDTEVQKILNDDAVRNSLKRLGGKTGVYTAQIDARRGNAKTSTVLGMRLTNFITRRLKHTNTLSNLLKAGIKSIFSSGQVVIPAPAGYHFQKPSGDNSTHFIRAEEALSRSEIVDFLALSLLVRMGERPNLKEIYIDTMGISSVAYALREMLRSGNPAIIPKITSFHSHEGLDTIDNPMPGTSFCIISASSSLSLERKWKQKTSCNNDEVVTLLTFKNTKDSNTAVFALDPPKNWGEHSEISLRGTKGMRTLGERFQQEQLPPKKIMLTRDYHPLDDVKMMAQQFWDHPFLEVDVATFEGKRRIFFANGEILVCDPVFKEWLEKEVRSKVPASVQGIIYQDDPSSRLMAEQCEAHLQEFGINLQWGVHSSSEYESHIELLDCKRGLLIVAAVVGQGHTLLGISRDLRASHEGSKSYFIGLQICAAKSESMFLCSNLAQTKDGTNQFRIWNCLATGSAMHQSLERQNTLGKAEPLLLDLLENRQHRLINEGLKEKTLLPTTQGRMPLHLRKDFLFWPEGYTDGAQHVGLVLATIGAVLENARTNTKLPDKHRLHSDTFQQVLLDPRNFSRYNDGIIQAALLRQALPSELDYSCTKDESEFMREFLIKIFSARSKPQGEAALEFALALATSRLQLKDEDIEIVCKKTSKLLLKGIVLDEQLQALLDQTTKKQSAELPVF